jgi:TatD DNase family protein
MIKRATDAGIKKFFLPNIDSHSIASMLSLSAEDSNCLPLMGLHPCSVNESWEQEISAIEEYLFNKPDIKFWGIGETGLDYYWDKTLIEKQKVSFQQHITWAKQLQLPIIIHSRDSTDDCIEMISKNKDENLKGVFHCFSGTADQAKKITELGFFLGIGGVITFKNGGLDQIMEHIDIGNVVLETDSPYLAPVPYRGKRNESSYLTFIAKKLASIKNLDVSEVASITSANASKLFQLTF